MTERKTPQNRFEFVVTAGARARQLIAGSIPRVEVGGAKTTTVAKREVLAEVVRKIDPTPTTPTPTATPTED